MSVDAIAAGIKDKVASSGFDSSIKFDCGDDGILVIDGTEVSTTDKEADCTISVALEDLQAIIDGDLNPTAAFMQGKVKVEGDMSVAMKLGEII